MRTIIEKAKPAVGAAGSLKTETYARTIPTQPAYVNDELGKLIKREFLRVFSALEIERKR